MIERAPLAPLTTFGIGGAARYLARCSSVADIRAALAFAREQALPVAVLGGGSNVLVADAGFPGVVLKIEVLGITAQEQGARVYLSAGAGESWDALVARAVEHGWWGIENLSGIPGTLGGAVVQNIGAYGAALSAAIESVSVFDTESGAEQTLAARECRFGYRGSCFKEQPGRYVVLGATLALSKTPAPSLAYADLAARFAGQEASLAAIRAAVLEIRAGKFPDLRELGTAGSFFKNPTVSAPEAQELSARYPGLPLFPLAESERIKVPLGWLLDYRHGVLDMRDVRVGGARMYEQQYLVLVALRGTTAHDVDALAREVAARVQRATGITIEREVETLGARELSTPRA